MTERIERCETCRFWYLVTDEAECRRHAPLPVQTDQLPDGQNTDADGYRAVWPITNNHDWCGEYQPTPPAAATRDGDDRG
jgi:hypothetical protein